MLAVAGDMFAEGEIRVVRRYGSMEGRRGVVSFFVFELSFTRVHYESRFEECVQPNLHRALVGREIEQVLWENKKKERMINPFSLAASRASLTTQGAVFATSNAQGVQQTCFFHQKLAYLASIQGYSAA